MKRDELKGIEGLSPEQIDAILSLHQKDVQSWQSRHDSQASALAERETTINSLNEKLKTFDGVDIKKMQKDYDELLSKYNADMTAKDKMFAKERLFDSVQWSSELAKNGAKALFDSKGLEFKEGKFEGVEEFLNSLKETDPYAFKSEESKPRTTGFEHGDALDGDELSDVEKAFYRMNPQLKK